MQTFEKAEPGSSTPTQSDYFGAIPVSRFSIYIVRSFRRITPLENGYLLASYQSPVLRYASDIERALRVRYRDDLHIAPSQTPRQIGTPFRLFLIVSRV